MSLKEFYANPDLADGFGSTKGGRPNPHRGLDFAHPAGTPIPVHTGGIVVLNEWTSVLGWVVEVAADGRYYGYRHMQRQSPFGVGSRALKGVEIGAVGNTGSASRGNHLCTTNGGQRGSVNGINVVDPWPQIFASVNAGDGDATAAPIIPVNRRKKTMILDWAGNTGYLTTDDGTLALTSMQVYNLFYRKINSDQLFHPNPASVAAWVPAAKPGRPQEFNAAEQDIVNAHLKLLSTQKATQITVDPTKLAAALKDALPGWSADVEVSPEALGKAFDIATPRVVNAILNEQARRLATKS